MRYKILKALAATILIVNLTGCNAVTGEAKRTIEYIFAKTPDVEMSEEEILEFPYTALYMNQEGSPQSLVVLGYIDGSTTVAQNFSWISQDRETIVTRHGRVIRTENLHANLTGVGDVERDPLRCVVTSPAECELSWSRHHDFQLRDGTRLSRRVSSEFEVIEEQALSLPAGEVNVTLVREHVQIDLQKRGYTNEFWLEPDGHVVKSKQWVLHNEPRFTLTQVKWVGRE